MKQKLLFTICTLLILASITNYKAQVTVLSGEIANPGETYIYSGDFNQGYVSCNFTKSKGMLSIGAEIQSDSYASWSDINVAIQYGGVWYNIYKLYTDNTNLLNTVYPANSNVYSYSASNYTNSATTYPKTSGAVSRYTKVLESVTNAGYQSVYMYNSGNLRRYEGNYLPLPLTDDSITRNGTAANANYSIRTRPYASNQFYPSSNPGGNGNPIVSTGLDVGRYMCYGNLRGVASVRIDPTHASVMVNLTNLPPEMLESPSFRVHIYGLCPANNTKSRIYETVYNNPNFMTSPPNGLAATQNLCGKVTLTWANSGGNIMPTDGGTINKKNVIFRDGNYLATVSGTVTTYDDLTAGQDTIYGYSIRHVAFSESGDTYFRSPLSTVVNGQVKPSPDQPISLSGSSNSCNGNINIAWNYNGTNPKYFKLESSSTSSSGPWFVNSSTIAGTDRNYTATGANRGTLYYLKMSAISTCSVLSLNAATSTGISQADPAMATGITATTNTLTGTIQISWLDNASNETKYEIVRTDDQGNTILTQVNANATTYTDNAAASCRLYTYKVRVYNDCVLSGITSTTSATATLPPPNLGNTFTTTKKMVASKGYFGNRVELSWSNNNGVNIDVFKIYRKQLGTSLDSIQITSLPGGNALFIDNTADARVFYRYTIVGIKTCNGSELQTNISSDIGFRLPAGLVSGHIQYNGGVAVSGAKVLIQPSGSNVGSSLKFQNTGTLTIKDTTTLEPGAQMRCEFWLKSLAVSSTILSKNNAFSFGKNGTNYEAKLFTNGTNTYTITVPTTKTISVTTGTTVVVNTITLLPDSQWNHISLVYTGSVFKVFANGILTNSVTANGTINDNNNNLVFGSATSKFLMDEFRLLGQSQNDSIIDIEKNRILNGDETNFKCNLHFDESVGNFAYDASKVGNFFNGNHGAISTNTALVNWDSDKPTGSQLGYFGVTDTLGNYNASGIRFIGNGQNFSLVPQYQTHSFSPNSRTVYIGDASYIYNNQDFTDNSSFPFTGTLFYKGTSCPVPGALLNIDGLPVVVNGQQAMTDAAGTFSISVPIGNHFVTVSKFGHQMKDFRYPPTGFHNFQSQISGVTFSDSTQRTIVGRVVGGLVEANKFPTKGRSKNNIGQAVIKLKTLDGCYTTSVTTNALTGEYKLIVPPLLLSVNDVSVTTNTVTLIGKTYNNLSNTSQLIDLTNSISTVVTDTVKRTRPSLSLPVHDSIIKSRLHPSQDSIARIDSARFDKRVDFVYRSSPSIDVSMLNGDKLIGDDTLKIGASKIPIKPIASTPSTLGLYNWGPFDWPIFTQDKSYSAKIIANEIYTNYDASTALNDTVRLSGSISIKNHLVDGTDPHAITYLSNGLAIYTFTCGSPNIASAPGTPDISYTKHIEITVNPDDAASKNWLPNSFMPSTNQYYRGIILGKSVTGTGIATQGPERVDFILRDPPGSGSSSTWSTGQTVTTNEEFTSGLGGEVGLSAEFKMGNKAIVGIGYATEASVESNLSIGLSVSTQLNKGNGFSETITSSNAVSTRDDAGNVGAPADIFIGKSRNWLVGPTANIELVDVTKCGVTCFGPTVNGKRISKTSGYTIAPADIKTRFSYTQDEIEKVVIPGLESIREDILKKRPNYTMIALPGAALFGANNDNPLWATPSSTTPTVFDKADTIGPSYIFRGYAAFIKSKPGAENDTVRIINNQIALWKQALAQNEREKLSCIDKTAGVLIENFTLGSAVVNNSYQTDNENHTTSDWELALTADAGLQIGGNLAGTGVEVSANLSIHTSKGGSNSNSTTNTTSFAYTLTDGDPGDIMSVDVYKLGSGNVFVTRGGQTMCPYEDAIVCHYYDPANPNAYIHSHTKNLAGFKTIANATVKREVPNIVITPSKQINIPSNQPAVFQLLLSNQSVLSVNNDIDLQVRVASASNPNGAVLKIDGQNANTLINIPSGGSVVKTLTIERGPIEINYDSLMVIFSSACSEDIADTAYVSVQFIPTCTDLSITVPTDHFIINNSNNNLRSVIIDNYNYNYASVPHTTSVPHTYTTSVPSATVTTAYTSTVVVTPTVTVKTTTVAGLTSTLTTVTTASINTPVTSQTLTVKSSTLVTTQPSTVFTIENQKATKAGTVLTTVSVSQSTVNEFVDVIVTAHPNYGFEKLGFEFKPSNSSSWTQIQDFYISPTAALAANASTLFPIPNGQVYTPYSWSVTPNNYPDGNYEIRAKSYCYNKDGSYATVLSPVLSGVMDRVNPAPFGTPSPGDGILDPNDDISIQFNEQIDISSLSYAPGANFDIRGVLNGSNIRHSESLNFDGVSNNAIVSGGASLQKRSFTIEFWAKLNATGINQTIISQGTSVAQKMTIGFDNTDKLNFTLAGDVGVTKSVITTSAVSSPTNWKHYAIVYDRANTDAMVYVDGVLSGTNNNFDIDYDGSGRLAFGKDIQANSNFLTGNLQDVRLWNKVRSNGDIVSTMNQSLNRNNSGLLYNWKMDEAEGLQAHDYIRSLNADINGASWEVSPNGNAVQFDGIDDNIQVAAGTITVNKETDFTLEFWFNSTQSGVATLFANGKGDGVGADSLDAWNIEKDATGQIHVKHKGLDFAASTSNYFDGKWHHFALVMQRSSNLSAYVDGNLQNSVQSTSFNNLSGAFMYLGARGYQVGASTAYDNYFNGKMDEFRFWNTARKTEQIKRDKQNRMLGDELGLKAFLPFESYLQVLGTPSLTPTFNNQVVTSSLTVNNQNGVALIAQTPTIKLPRPIQAVNYTWSLNNDKIILSTTTAPELIENVTLDITVKNALDMHGNIMQSPKTWIAYINKNQVKWQNDLYTFEKTVDSVITFTTKIVNTGGALKTFDITGVPIWMTADITHGTVAPNSTKDITFTIPAGGNIGNYDADISLITDFNYAEMMRVNLKVKGIAPTWTVNPSNFQYSMNVFGQFKIDNVISTNPESKIAAFNNGVICGVANLQYVQAYDRYEAFINVYDNKITGDSIRFNIYDASTGLTFVNVSPSLMFVENDVVGTVTNPITFVANTEVARDIPLNAGWTWVSFPLKSSRLTSSNLLMNSVRATTGDVVLSNSAYDQYDSGLGWLGNISQGAGYFNNQSYKIKTAHADTLVHIGTRLNPDSIQAAINIVPGWNWIGYIATKNLGVNEALGNYIAVTGDLIKSQYEFAYYDNSTGWTGSLNYMKPTMGYMLKSNASSTFHYPLSAFVGRYANTGDGNSKAQKTTQNIFPFTPEVYGNTMSAIITGNICHESLDQNNVVVGAFDVTNTLRGYAYPIKNASTGKYNFYLTLYSNLDNEVLNIKYFNTTDGSLMPTTNVMTFSTNALAGTPSTPIVANVEYENMCNVVNNTTGINELNNSINFSVYPNPFSDNLYIKFNQSVSAKIELVDMLGKVVFTSNIQNKKEYNMSLEANKSNIALGMYYIRLTGDVNGQIKVIKTK